MPSRPRVVHVSIDKIKSICNNYAALLFNNNINRFERIVRYWTSKGSLMINFC